MIAHVQAAVGITAIHHIIPVNMIQPLIAPIVRQHFRIHRNRTRLAATENVRIADTIIQAMILHVLILPYQEHGIQAADGQSIVITAEKKCHPAYHMDHIIMEAGDTTVHCTIKEATPAHMVTAEHIMKPNSTQQAKNTINTVTHSMLFSIIALNAVQRSAVHLMQTIVLLMVHGSVIQKHSTGEQKAAHFADTVPMNMEITPIRTATAHVTAADMRCRGFL